MNSISTLSKVKRFFLWKRIFPLPKDAGSRVDREHLPASFYRILSYRFQDEALLIKALTHRSYYAENPEGGVSNERLEFLGDAVLGLVVSDVLYRLYPDSSEGELTQFKSVIVRRETLATQAKKMGLGRFLILGAGEEKSGGRNRVSILADAYEAVLGAVFLDGGLNAAKNFLEKHLLRDIETSLKSERHRNFKSILLEYSQKRWQAKPEYCVLGETGPDHQKEFLVEVRVKTEVLGKGRGKSKKGAEQEAARRAVEQLGLS